MFKNIEVLTRIKIHKAFINKILFKVHSILIIKKVNIKVKSLKLLKKYKLLK